MGDVVQFISKSERERARLVQEARAIYDSIFPPDDRVRDQQNETSAGQTVSADKFRFSDRIGVS